MDSEAWQAKLIKILLGKQIRLQRAGAAAAEARISANSACRKCRPKLLWD